MCTFHCGSGRNVRCAKYRNWDFSLCLRLCVRVFLCVWGGIGVNEDCSLPVHEGEFFVIVGKKEDCLFVCSWTNAIQF